MINKKLRELEGVDLVEYFLRASKAEKNLCQRTLKAYRCDLVGCRRFFHRKPLHFLSTDDIRHYILHLEQSGLEYSSIKRKIAVLKVFYAFLRDEKLIKNQPTASLNKRYKTCKRLPRVISIEEVTNLLETAHAYVNKARFQRDKFRRLRDQVVLEILFVTGRT
ncbi:MAG: site-specific integrase [bacterium]